MIRMFFRLLGQGVRDLSLNPWAQIFTLAAVTLVAFLSGLFLMALTTVNHQLGTARGETAFQVYWRPGTDLKSIREQWRNMKDLPGFDRIKTYTPDEALIELGRRLGRDQGTAAKTFPHIEQTRPLPATALLTFAPIDNDIETWISQTADHLKSLPGVERVVTTPLRDELGQAWRKVSSYVMWPSICFLALVLALVVGNTIRLSLLSRQHEIEILKLVGAFNWYIRTPLVVGGALQGFIGSAIALALLTIVHSQIRDVLNFPPLLMEIRFLSLPFSIGLILVPTLMGIAASWVAVRDEKKSRS